MSLEGIVADAENVEVFYFKETISFNKLQEGGSQIWETAILYKFYVRLETACKLLIYLPFSLQGKIDWKQENMRSKDYQIKVAYAKRFERVEDDFYNVEFYEELGRFTALLPTNEEMKGISKHTTRELKGKTSSVITVDITKLNLPKYVFRKKNCGFGFMFKVRTRDFLTEENMKKLDKAGQFWGFDIRLYPATSSVTEEQKEKLVNLHNADIWAILPKNTSILHLNPQPHTVITMEEEDEDLEDFAYVQTKAPYKTYQAGQIAICWDPKNIKKEEVMHYIGHSPTEHNIGEILDEVEDVKNSLKDLNEQLRLHKDETEKNIQKVSESLVRELNELSRTLENLTENMSKQYVTMRSFIFAILAIISICIALYVSIVNLIVNLIG